MPETNSDAPAKDEPKGVFEKLGAALPVGLTALATVFAGMSTGALQQAMYWKSQSAQDQAKATNQWTLAGFKRDRALVMQTTAAQLRAMSGYSPATFSVPANPKPELERAVEWLTKNGPPRAELPKVEDPAITELLDAIRTREPEHDILTKASKVKFESINKVIDDAEKASETLDRDWDPSVKAAAALVADETKVKADDPKRAEKLSNATAAQAAGFEMEQRRYRAESTLNQGIGYLYEARVKITSAESDKHRQKSQHFFLAMLAAQIGATISAMALARRQKSALWFFASLVGLISIGYGAYVFLT